jgi:dihydroneopterin aldolase
VAQPLLLNIELEMPSAKPFTSDKLADAVNYAAIVERLQAFAADHPHKLLERFSDAVAEIVRGEFGAPWVSVSVAKLAPMPGVKQIGVTVEREKKLKSLPHPPRFAEVGSSRGGDERTPSRGEGQG